MIMRAHLRSIAIATLLFGTPNLTLAATFQGPSQQPPSGNAPGVIWNVKNVSPAVQQDAEINIPGFKTNGVTRDVYVSSTKAFRVDTSSGMASYSMGNWGYGVGPQPLTYYLNGDLTLTDYGASPGQRGRVQASEFCFNPGSGPSDCISDWASAGGSGFVLKAGDTMTGRLQIQPTKSGAIGNFENLYSYLAPAANSSFGDLDGVDSVVVIPNTSGVGTNSRAVIGTMSVNGATASVTNAVGVGGTAAAGGTGGTVTNLYGGAFTSSPSTNGIVTRAQGVRGEYNSIADFTMVIDAAGVAARALNSAPTKLVSNLYGLDAYARGKASTRIAGINNLFESTQSTPANQFGIDSQVSQESGTPTALYGIRSQITRPGGSTAGVLTNAYGIYSTVSSAITATNRYGVYGDSSNGTGVYGIGSNGVQGSGSAYGVYGAGTGVGTGVYGTAANGIGVQGNGTSYGGYFTGSTYGVSGSATYAGATFTGTTYGMLVNGTGVGIDVNVPNGAGAQRGMHIHMPSKGDGVQIDNADRGIVITTVGLNGTGAQITSSDVGVSAMTQGTGVNNTAGVFQSGDNFSWLGVKNRAGIYAYANNATTPAAGEFANNNSKVVYLAGNSNAIEVKQGSTSEFYVNSSGEVHSRAGAYPGYYFHDRQNNANVIWAWYADGGAVAANSMARLFRSTSGGPGNDILRIDVNGNMSIGSGTTGCLKDIDGTILAGTCASDMSLKKNIREWNADALSVISNLSVKTYDWKDGGKNQIGLIAQDVQKVEPQLAQIGEDGKLMVHFEELPFYTIKAVQQLKSENDELKSKIETLEQRLNKLEQKLK